MKNLFVHSLIILITFSFITIGNAQVNTIEGKDAGISITTGINNSIYGKESCRNMTTGDGNTAVGHKSLFWDIDGSFNTALGIESMFHNGDGGSNVAVGAFTLRQNDFANNNTAVGYSAMYWNISGADNTAVGYQALFNSNGWNNTAVGAWALRDNTEGEHNTASGMSALLSNTEGKHNCASGFESLKNNTTGNRNTGIGNKALFNNSTGFGNTALGYYALRNNKKGNYNTAVGYLADVSGSGYKNATAIGYKAKATASNRVRIGNDGVTQIGGVVPWTSTSDGAFKTNVKDSDLGLDFITKLRPVTYNMATEHEGILYTGFIAQEVESVLKEMKTEFSGLCTPEGEEDNYGLRYGNFVVPLVKSVQEQQEAIDLYIKLIGDLDERITKLESLLAAGGNFNPEDIGINNSGVNNIEIPHLAPNYPNPFSDNTTISYHIPKEVKEAHLHIFDTDGNKIFTKEITERGEGNLIFKGSDLKAGSYFYTLICDGKITETKQMIKI